MSAGFDFSFSFRPAPARRVQADVFRILVMGDLVGGAARSRPLAARVPVRVDVDNFDEVFRRFSPALSLELRGQRVDITFDSLEEFHADALWSRLPVFGEVRDRRARLLNPATAQQTMAELGAAGSGGGESDADTLGRLLGNAPPAPQAPAPAGKSGVDGIINALLQQAVGTGARQAPAAGRDAMLQAVDSAAAELMRELLHHPAFQSLEATWRGVYQLVSDLGGDGEVRLSLFDVGRDELLSDLQQAGGRPDSTGLWSQIVEGGAGAPGGQAWSTLVGLFSFGPGAGDVALLAQLGSVGLAVGAPFLAGASPALLGIASLADTPDSREWPGLEGEEAERWQALRASPVAPWIGLGLPRILLRLPYGKKGEPVSGFPFEEMGGGFRHDDCLWGNPGTGLAQLLGMAWEESAEGMEPGELLDIEDLPAWVRTVDGEPVLQPCAEVLLGERALEVLLAAGLMPFLSHRDRNAVRLARFQSIASPARELAGRWQGDD